MRTAESPELVARPGAGGVVSAVPGCGSGWRTAHAALIAQILDLLSCNGARAVAPRAAARRSSRSATASPACSGTCRPTSRPEIAGELSVSTSIMSRLTCATCTPNSACVHRRTEAVESARALGLLAPAGPLYADRRHEIVRIVRWPLILTASTMSLPGDAVPDHCARPPGRDDTLRRSPPCGPAQRRGHQADRRATGPRRAVRRARRRIEAPRALSCSRCAA